MTVTVSVNYTVGGTDFSIASAATDALAKEHIWKLARAVEDHDHSSTRGLAIRRIQTGSTPAAAGQLQVTGDTFRWWAATAAAVKTAADLDSAQTLTSKTLTSPTVSNLTNMQHGHTNAASGGTLTLDGSAITTGITGTGNVVKATSPTITTPTMTGPVVSSGGMTIAGNVGITGTLTTSAALTVSAGGIAVTGASTIAGTLGSITTLTATTIAGTLSTAAQPNITSLGTLTSLALAGAVSGVTTLTATTVTATNLGGTLTTAAQPNITSHGTLTSLLTSGSVYVGDTSNAFSTLGVTINQGAAANEALALKSSDVAHGRTDATETDTYGLFKKHNALTGGLHIEGYSEDVVGTEFLVVGNNVDATHNANSNATFQVRAYTDQVTGFANMGAGDNLFGVINGSLEAVFFVLGDGDVYNSGGSTAMVTFDDQDDAALVEAVGTLMNPGRVRDYRYSLATDLAAHKQALAAGGVIALDPAHPERFMMSYKGMLGLLIDAIRQGAWQTRQLAARVDAILPG